MFCISHTAHRYSTSSSDSSTITKIAVENAETLAASTAAAATATTMRRPSKWKSSLVYFMDPCIEDCTFNNVLLSLVRYNCTHK